MVPVSVPLNVPAPDALLNVMVVSELTFAGLPPASCTCTVTVKATPAVPVGGTEVKASFVGTAVKVTVAVCATTRLSVVSVAWKTSAPAVVDLTVNVATPEASVVP
jgi:hypothetical protein